MQLFHYFLYDKITTLVVNFSLAHFAHSRGKMSAFFNDSKHSLRTTQKINTVFAVLLFQLRTQFFDVVQLCHTLKFKQCDAFHSFFARKKNKIIHNTRTQVCLNIKHKSQLKLYSYAQIFAMQTNNLFQRGMFATLILNGNAFD